jgi:phosphoglycerate dehydrogenase-like enzyme
LLLLLAALRRLPQWRPFLNLPSAAQNAHPVPIASRTLHGRTLSLHGFGQIARQIIRLTAPFNVRVRAYSEGVPADYMRANGAEPVSSLAGLFAGADTFIEVEALTPKTVGSVTAELIDSLAPDAVFVNVGRGAVVDEAALARRAARGDLQLALDVLAVEPLPADSPLRDLPDALISPHIGGPTRDQLPVFATRVAENIRRYFVGEPLLQPITTEIYDRST